MENQSCLELPTYFQQFIHLSRYARWIPELGRREMWPETVMRYLDFMCDFQCKGKVPPEMKAELARAITCLEVMPSMRCMMTAGEALRQSNISGYNCSYIAVDHPSAFDETLLILMNGTGVGFSVERQFICNLPAVAERLRPSNSVIVVEDSKLGWADGLRELISSLYAGIIPKWDLSKVRPAGARLKTFGGRASGPGPLDELFRFCVDMFKEAAGKKLTSIECHDLMCKIAEVVVVGGVRRCLADGTLVKMSDSSWRPIEDVKKGEMVLLDGDSLPITNVFDNGVQEVVEVCLDDGTSFVCTPEHRWFVYDHDDDSLKWVETKNLSSGNYSFVEPEE